MIQPLPPRAQLTPPEIAPILDGLSRATVAVLGDFCLDVYWMVDRSGSEISIETGLPTEPVRRQRYSPGGAGNVVANLLALEVGRIHPAGVIGDDPFGRELAALLNHTRVDCAGLLVQPRDWATHTYVKPHVGTTELNRIDFGNFNQPAEETLDRFFASLETILAQVSVVLVNHQAKGSIHDSPAFRERLAAAMRSHPGVCFVVDSRGYHGDYPGAVHKLNDREVMRACGVEIGDGGGFVPLGELLAKMEMLRARWRSPLVVTRGERGCIVFDGDVPVTIFGIQLPGKTDPVGAGDTFVSMLAAILATGADLTTAASVANIAAAVTAGKILQTGAATRAEVLALAAAADYIHLPELAQSPHHAAFVGNSEIEIVAGPPPGGEIRHAIFDHDGTISTLREGWEKIMKPMMIASILGSQRERVDEALRGRVEERVLEFIDRTTGIQTINQMHGLVEMVGEFGLVPPAEIRTPELYKEIYNEELLAMVNRRLAKLDSGELAIGDFTLKGAVSFLHALRDAGVRLHLASGTNDADVKREAQRLGYAALFDGGIHGSVGEVDRDPKKVVLERIMAEIGGAFGQVITFGDGPVEIRETARRGGYSVGVASDEIRRFGLNLEKRARLIRAGACAIIPDFSQGAALLAFLNLPKL